METLCKLYLELANVVPKDCLSKRDLVHKAQIDDYGLTLLMIREGAADPREFAEKTLAKWRRD